MYYVPLNKKQQAVCLEDIGYSLEQLEADCGLLRKWLNEQEHLPASRLKENDGFLKSFLLGCKGSLEKSKKKIDNYYSFRSSGCPYFGRYDLNSKGSKAVKDVIQMGIMPKCLNDTTRVHVFRAKPGLNESLLLYSFQCAIMLFELDMRREDVRPMSFVFLYDVKDATVSEFLKTNPLFMRDFFHILREILPIRVKNLLYINVHPALSTAANFLIKPFISKKINERMRILSTGLDSIADVIHKSDIPKEMGGEGEYSLDNVHGDFIKTMTHKQDWFAKELSEKTDESKRPESSKRSENPYVFGVEGTFKALVID